MRRFEIGFTRFDNLFRGGRYWWPRRISAVGITTWVWNGWWVQWRSYHA